MKMNKIKVEILSYEKICHGCLSLDRNVAPLGELSDLFYKLSTLQATDYPNILLCWECRSVLRKTLKFQQRIHQVQSILQQPDSLLKYSKAFSLSALGTSIHDNLMIIEHDYKENDRKVKIEIALDINKDSDVDDKVNDDYYSDADEKKNNLKQEKIDHIKVESSEYKLDFKDEKRHTKCKKHAVITKNNFHTDNIESFYVKHDLNTKVLEEVLERRMMLSYKKDPRYKCKICRTGFQKNIDLKRHKIIKHPPPNGPFKCSECQYSGNLQTLYDLYDHWKSHVVLKCTLCPEVCRSTPEVTRHLMQVHRYTYQCVECGKTFNALREFFRHYKDLHRRMICDHCGKTFVKKQTLETHMRRKHLPPICSTCDRVFKSVCSLRSHSRVSHPELHRDRGKSELSYCVECNKQFTSVYKYRRHLSTAYIHRPPKPVRIPCPDCGKVFSRKIYMNNHYKLFHVKKSRHHCEICDKYYVTAYALRNHRLCVHEKSYPPKDKICEICGRGFSRMDDNTERVLTKLCCTCLCNDRKMLQLCGVNDGVNNLYWLLSYDIEAFREGFHKDSASFFICWECRAVMAKICTFRNQACCAQRQLTVIADGRHNKLRSLSKLSYTIKGTYDYKFEYEETEVLDNFIDCGPMGDIKEEFDLDGGALAEQYNDHTSYDNDTNIVNTTLKIIQSPIANKTVRKKQKKGKVENENSFSFDGKQNTSTTDTNEEETIDINTKNLSMTYVDGAFKCETCLEVFKVKIDLTTHNLEMHQNSKNKSAITKNPESKPKRNKATNDLRTPLGFLCTECNKYFNTKKSRWIHVQRCHREGFECSSCGKRFPFKNNLTRHLLTHTSPPRVQCAVCQKAVRADLVRAHARTHGAREQCTCAPCGKRFASRASYHHHLKYTQVHALRDVLKYKCSVCDKGYKSKGELRDHINYQHMGKTQHKCPVCGKALATRRCVTRHVRRAHEGIKESERDKICQQCGKAFRDKKGLREHELIHTGERPLSCEICGCTFRQNSSLYTHRKRVHKICTKRKQVELVESERPDM